MSRTDSMLRLWSLIIACALATASCSPSTLPSESASGIEGIESTGAGSLVASELTEHAANRGGFYPLDLGNRWRYANRVVVRVLPDKGVPPDPLVEHGEIRTSLVCANELSGRSYVIERNDETTFGNTSSWWSPLRQDRTGLYALDFPSFDPAPCETGEPPTTAAVASARPARLVRRMSALLAATSPSRRAAFEAATRAVADRLAALPLGTFPPTIPSAEARTNDAEPGEITKLAYPLYPGARWIIRDEPGVRFEALVEAVETLRLPAGEFSGFRVRITTNLAGSADRVHAWYGRAGLLAISAHFEAPATDETGAIIGRVTIEQRQQLAGLSLGRPRRSAQTAPAKPVSSQR